jgi:hypothetical protein
MPFHFELKYGIVEFSARLHDILCAAGVDGELVAASRENMCTTDNSSGQHNPRKQEIHRANSIIHASSGYIASVPPSPH